MVPFLFGQYIYGRVRCVVSVEAPRADFRTTYHVRLELMHSQSCSQDHVAHIVSGVFKSVHSKVGLGVLVDYVNKLSVATYEKVIDRGGRWQDFVCGLQHATLRPAKYTLHLWTSGPLSPNKYIPPKPPQNPCVDPTKPLC